MSTDPAGMQRLPARESIIGSDTRIRRALPNRELRTVGAWCFLDHAGPVQFAAGRGMHVGPHPHIGLQTFTWMMAGEVMHRDSLGHQQVIRPGQVNLMTAGRGIVHSEDSVADGATLHAAQLWIALPEGERHREPDFRHYPELPVVLEGGFRVTVLAGSACGRTSPVQVYSPLVGLDLAAPAAGEVALDLEPHFEYAALVLVGEARVAGEALAPGTLLYLAPGDDRLSVVCEQAARILLLGGEPLGEDILLWWNFVGRSQADMEEAIADWHARSPRFPVVPGAVTPPLEAPSLAGVRLKGRVA